MKERPILFSAPMVRALLDGSKTQTRRVVKHRWPHLWNEPWYATGRVLDALPTQPGAFMEFRHRTQDVEGYQGSTASTLIPCPYGKPGDRLWVKETWRTAASLDDKSPSAIGDMCVDAGYRRPWAPLAYEADKHRNSEWRGFEIHGDAQPGKTRVSIHMPRWASRIALEITGVRVERLQDISRGDAMEEGCPFPNMAQGDNPRAWYADLWQQINAAGRPVLPSNPNSKRYARVKAWLDKHPDTTSWDANPWVWVVEFQSQQP